MMTSTTWVRILFLILAASVGCYGIISGAAEITVEGKPQFPKELSKIDGSQKPTTEWLATIAPLRSDLDSSRTMSLALNAIQQPETNGKPSADDRVLLQLRQTLSARPYDAELWLTLAILEARKDPNGPGALEALRMCYLTAPSDMRLMPLRLAAATRFDALSDPDLREFARSDVRFMIIRKPEQGSAVASVYRRASGRGKEFLEDAVQAINPSFLKSLRG